MVSNLVREASGKDIGTRLKEVNVEGEEWKRAFVVYEIVTWLSSEMRVGGF